MTMAAGTIKFRDQERDEEGVAVVRYDGTSVCVCLSLQSDGDVEVTMTKEDAKRLAAALGEAAR